MDNNSTPPAASRRSFMTKAASTFTGVGAGLALGACGGGSSGVSAAAPVVSSGAPCTAVAPKPQAIAWPAPMMVPGGSRTNAMNIAVREFGNPSGKPILFIHGFSQSMQCWNHQVMAAELIGFRLITMDLRGHGDSDRALPANFPNAGYQPVDQADDVAAVIAAKGLVKPVIVAWSFGGIVLGDYLKAHGTGKVAGLNFVGALTRFEATHTSDFLGPGFLGVAVDWFSPIWPNNIKGSINFVAACTNAPLSVDDFATTLACNIAVPWTNRAATGIRPDIFHDQTTLNSIAPVPTVVTHGSADQVVLPASSDAIVAAIAGATLSRYDGVGHMPFVEDVARFNRELAALRASV
ncbi:alpha/beta fold hydrolase [Variovorax sp. E3]|uniref:alpha/beta fold hydrolase n=1 Tax=Variovorax sp. E3 TaxID=1914993 RepID=UPI0018DD1F1D|nr:alpha/beta hydrolase [Variovorax sp. E3]